MGLALLFPGQGTQHPGMLPWLDAQPEATPLLSDLAVQLGSDWRERLGDGAWTQSNAVAQPLLAGIELAAWSVLAPRLPVPAVVAGYSVGELAAFAAAGAITPGEARRLAAVRAAAMDAAAAGQPGSLLAVRDLPPEVLAAWCARHGLAVAIRLGPDRAIVGGTQAALQAARQDPAAVRADLKDIGVRVASHTPWMQPAADSFARSLEPVAFTPPRATVVCNATGAGSRQPVELRRCLAAQLAAPIPWDTCLDSMAERQPACVLEVGPGSTLSAMWRARHPGIPARSVDEFRCVPAIVDWVAKTLDGR